MTFDKAKAAARFEAQPYETGCGTIYVRKPRVKEYVAFLAVVREQHAAQQAAGPGAQFDPTGETDLMLVRISAVDSDGAFIFADNAEVEAMLSPGEILDIALAANAMIHPTANPTTALAPS